MPKLLWSYPAKAGRRATSTRPSSTVRVYERADAPGTIWMERGWITTEKGNPIPKPLEHGTTREAAELLAEQTALKRRRRILQGVDEFGREPETPAPTVREILDAYHESRVSMSWSESHRKEQDRCRRFLSELLGPDRTAAEIPADEIMRKVAEAGEARGWTSNRSERRYLQYLRTAGRWAWEKGELVDQPLWMAVDLPRYRPDTTGRVYSKEQSRLLYTPHPEVDWRVTLAAAIASDTGRRISAICGIWVGVESEGYPPSDLAVKSMTVDGERIERLWIRFSGETDKVDQSAIRPVSPATRQLIEEALQRPEVLHTGWLFPEGRLDQSYPIDKPIDASSIIKLLRKAEEVLGIEYVFRRAYHGLKKRHVTLGYRVSGRDETVVADMVGNLDMALLRGTYRQEDLERILRYAEAVREEFARRDGPDSEAPEGGSEGPETGHENGHTGDDHEGPDSGPA